MVGTGTDAGDGVRRTDGGPIPPHGNAIRARERAEVVIERTILLHDEDHMLDVFEPLERGIDERVPAG